MSSGSSFPDLGSEVSYGLSVVGSTLSSAASTAEQVGSEAVSTVEKLGSEALSALESWGAGVLSQIEAWGGQLWNDLGDMSLPPWLVKALAMAGVSWPVINGSDVQQFAKLLREFVDEVESTHQEATNAVNDLAQVAKSQSIQAMLSGWLNLTLKQIDELLSFCRSLADVLDYASQAVPALKAAALYQLGTYVVAAGGLVVATVFSGGAAVAVDAEVMSACVALVENQVRALAQQIVTQVIEQALQPKIQALFQWIEQLPAGLDWEQAAQAVTAKVDSYLASAAAGLDIDVVAAGQALTAVEALDGELQTRVAPVLQAMGALVSSVEGRMG